MSTSNLVSADEFQALEQKVLRAVEIVKREREARAAAEAEVGRLKQQLTEAQQEHADTSDQAARELDSLRAEREQVRQRVEAMLHQMDELI